VQKLAEYKAIHADWQEHGVVLDLCPHPVSFVGR
jgi:hypothetical protein